MKFSLVIDSNNDAVQTREDIAEIIAGLSENITDTIDSKLGIILDRNGNSVGVWKIDDD